jgi:hypothetical protein
MKAHARGNFVLVGGMVVAGLIAATVLVTVSRPASATPQFATQTGKACGACHQNPAGGGALKPAGQKFKDNGNK